MTRVRTDNVFGVTTDNPLTSGATTMNSAGLANLAVVSSTEALIVLDPNRIDGAPEIVVVTAHTGSATSATIQRGQFGTSAREHPAGTEWVHGPIASNASSYATAADDQGDFVPMNAWETWTPTWTNFTPSTSTVVAKFMRVGRTVFWRLRVTLAGSPVVGDVRFSLPVAAAADYLTNTTDPIGQGNLSDANVGSFEAAVFLSGSSEGRIVSQTGAAEGRYAILSSTAPFTWVVTDAFMFSGTYEAAS